jgi:ribonuclease HI
MATFWERMRFRDQFVWVRVDETGRPVLDADGRAEMKYRETDDRSYRPGPSTLRKVDGPPTRVPDDGRPTTPAEPRGARTGGAAAGKGGGSTGGAGKAAPSRRSAGALPGGRAKAPAALENDGDAIHVWTDGACTGNPGPMGIGVVVLGPGGTRRELGEYLGQGTNNIAELTAIGRGLDLAAELFPGLPRPVRIYSDSSYAIGLLSQGWKAKANQELVAKLRAQVADVPDIRFVKVAGHAGIPENERCDELGREAISRRGHLTLR